MDGKKQKKFVTVAPFECAWRKDLRFREAGRGCVAFEAFADNDVTVVFREHVAGQHYHYKMDNSPHYTVILGSHRNRRLKIVVDGKTVVDEVGVGLCCSSGFQSYWISIYDGLISIGKGNYPFQNLVFQWLDSNPNCSVQYVGLGSWDKHVGYKNVHVFPVTQNRISLWKHMDHDECKEDEYEEVELEDGCEGFGAWGLEKFLESWDLSDMLFVVGKEERAVPAHKVILVGSGNFHFSSSKKEMIRLPGVTYPVLCAFLRYVYTGRTQISELELGFLKDLSLQFEIMPLLKQCEEMMEHFKANEKFFDTGKKVEISYKGSQPQQSAIFPYELPFNVQSIKHLLSSGEYSDVNIYVDGHELVARAHKIIISLWSVPFMKMFTNGMSESISSEIVLRDVSPDAFTAMLEFMYSGQLVMKDTIDSGSLLLQLLLLADQYGVTPLHQECCKFLLECLCEDSVCPILQVVSSVPSCKLLQETCERKFSMHFDYCTTASTEFVLLDDATFCNIIQHPDLTVTSEERVLQAILLWCMQAKEMYGWEAVNDMLKSSTTELLFRERFHSLNVLLPFVRFPLMPLALLKKLEKSNLSIQIPEFHQLVTEAIHYSDLGTVFPGNDPNVRFQHRKSSFKELQYICDGDNNGVIYFAGTSYGEHQWINPVLTKKIALTASTPASRYTDPKALVSRTYQAASFAGLRIEDGKKCAWWMVDIGQDHQLMCNYYTFRQDGSTAYVRSWALQGSLDGNSWTNLREHENDQTVCKPGQFASWPVHGPTALLPFRFFRIILTGPTTSDLSPWNLCICFLELYGYFH